MKSLSPLVLNHFLVSSSMSPVVIKPLWEEARVEV